MKRKTEIDINQVIREFLNYYSENKFKPELNELTGVLLQESLSARGYNNFQNNYLSGESFFIENILAPSNPKLCFDIGANIGAYTKEILEKTQASVVSFEPMPTAFEMLKKNVADFEGRIVVENKGVGARSETLTIHYNPNALAHASFSEDVKNVSYVSNEMKAEVPVTTLDEYCAENSITEVDFIKIDTEGFEAEVFEGALHVFGGIKPRFIQIEFNWHQLFRNTSLNYFAEKLPDYEVYQLLPNGWIIRDPKDPLTNIYHFSNFVFVLK